MPVCEVSYAEGLFSPKEEKQIVEKITKLLLKVESRLIIKFQDQYGM